MVGITKKEMDEIALIVSNAYIDINQGLYYTLDGKYFIFKNRKINIEENDKKIEKWMLSLGGK